MLEKQITNVINQLLVYSIQHALIEEIDCDYYRNGLLALMQMDAPDPEAEPITSVQDETATRMLGELCDLAIQKGILEDLGYERELFSTRAMGILTPAPKQVREAFWHDYAQSPETATEHFYHLCQVCDYVKVDAIRQNVRYFSDTPAGNLEITINLSKPEKDPKEIAKLKNAPSVGYPLCMLCKENPGYAGRSNFPARQNHRIIPLQLHGQSWYLQYSPYAYYNEHCIVFNEKHIPMKIDRGTFERLFAFVEQFPHYFIGSNADLPIVGGSILNHDHFQGGHYTFPMDQAEDWIKLKSPEEGIAVSILRWPMTTLCLQGHDPVKMTDFAEKILAAWRTWSDKACGILAQTDAPHNTITPILRRVGSNWKLNLVLRNNRTSEACPLGIFHPHTPLHHIKKENIGLIEVMGLFILPGRLKSELADLEGYLTGEKACVEPPETDPSYKHYAWVCDIIQRKGICPTREEAQAVLHQETALVCAQVLADSGVYKLTEDGKAGILRFVKTLGMEEE